MASEVNLPAYPEARLPDVASQPMAQQGWFETNGQTLIVGGAAKRSYRYCKRAIDVLVSLALLILLSPIMLIVAILIKLDSLGPVLFAQRRVGCQLIYRGGRVFFSPRTFHCYKFRSMMRNAEEGLHQACVRDFVNGNKEVFSRRGTFKLGNDPRITRVGRWLRKTSIDELPQLFNVLKGEMSLVGPRPVPTYEVALYHQTHLARLGALPGITGLWQVMGRCQLSFEEMIRLDLDYVRRSSLWLDFEIMLRTIPAVISGRGT